MKVTTFLTCCLTLLLAACGAPWQPVEHSVVQGSDNAYQVQLPGGWMRNVRSRENVFISRDGPGLQTITIRAADHEQAFKAIQERSSDELLPSELAELVIALIKNEKNMTRVEILENNPALVGGQDGFRLHIAYESQRGLDYEEVVYGCADPHKVYLLRYYGPGLYYFPRDLPTFEAMVESFMLSTP